MDARTQALRFAGGSFDALRGELRVGDRRARLRPRSAAVLALLLDERGRVVGRDELMRHVWPDVVVTDDSLAQCIKEIRRALGPAAERIRTVPRVGYAFADAVPEAPAEPVAPVEADAPAQAVAPADAAQRVAPVRWLGGALALVALLALGLSVEPSPAEAPPYSLAVLPLAGDAALADGLADDLTTDLSRIPGAFVVARRNADGYRDRPLDARGIGRELGVRYLVEGSVQRAGADVALNLRLVDAQAGGVVWSERFADAESGDLRRISQRIARSLQLVLIEDEAAREQRHPSANPEQALQRWRARLRDDPHQPTAWLWTAVARLQLGDYAGAAADAEQAIRLAPDDERAPLFFGVLGRAKLYAGDAAGALAAAEQAARLPGPSRYAPLLVAAAAMQLGDAERARRAVAEFAARNPGYSAASLRAARPAGARDGERDERYIASLVAAGLPER